MITPSDTTAGVKPTVVMPQMTVRPLPGKVLISTPWYKSVNPLTAFSVAQLADRRRTATALSYGDAFVAHTRNTCVDYFLDSTCDWIMMIDDDMVVPVGNAAWFNQHTKWNLPEPFASFNALDRLISHGKTVVGALYRARHSDGPFVYNEGGVEAELKYVLKGPHNVVKPTRWVGTGCILIHRQVFLDIEKKFPRLARNGKFGGNWFTSTEATITDGLDKIRDALQVGQKLTGETAHKALEAIEALRHRAVFDNPLGTGEDVAFCLRAQAAGHTPFVDLGLRCGHIGTAIY